MKQETKAAEEKIVKEKKILIAEIAVPQDIRVVIKSHSIHLKKGDKEIERAIHPFLLVKQENNMIIITARKNRKTEKRLLGTLEAHIHNMINGLEKPFMYKLQVVNVHFPMMVSHDKAKDEFVVKNFLGEKNDRRIPLVKGVAVKINKDIIEIESHDIEKAGQAATNIEKGTHVRNKDRRVYQDGIFIIEKPGRSYL